MILLDNDNKNKMNKVGITRNEEPTRFLTKEEMEQLDQRLNNININQETTTEDNVQGGYVDNKLNTKEEKRAKSNKIKIEDVSPVVYSESKKNKVNKLGNKLKNIIKKFLVILSFIVVAILGFYLAYTWNMPINKDEQSSSVIEKIDVNDNQKIDKQTDQDINKTDKNLDDEVNDFEQKLNHAKEIINEADVKLEKIDEATQKVKEMKESMQDVVDEHKSDIEKIEYEVNLLINNILEK